MERLAYTINELAYHLNMFPYEMEQIIHEYHKKGIVEVYWYHEHEDDAPVLYIKVKDMVELDAAIRENEEFDPSFG